MKLNNAQQLAANFKTGAALVIAGAGCGKTKVLTERIKNLIFIDKALPESIVALTFTNKAAKEMLERVERALEHENILLKTKPFIGTFHSYCFLLLKRYGDLFELKDFTILDAQDQQAIVKKILVKHHLEKEFQPKKLLGLFSMIKNNEQPLSSFDKKTNIWDLYQEYERDKKTANVLDFDDLILHVFKALKRKPEVFERYFNTIEHILIDEYQDTSHIQHEFVKLLAFRGKKSQQVASVFAVGDQDQSIYSWRGAVVENVNHFFRDFKPVESFKIEQNYRSAQGILSAANALIENNPNRLSKKLWSEKDHKNCIFVANCKTEYQEADVVVETIKHFWHKHKNDKTYAILYRNHSQSRIVEESLINNQIKYVIIGGLKFYERKEIKDLLSYLKLICNKRDLISLARILNTPTRGLGDKVLERLDEKASTEDFESVFELLEPMISELKMEKQKLALESFCKNFSKESLENQKASDVLEFVLEKTKYLDYLDKEKESEEDFENRKRNIEELKKSMRFFEDKNPQATVREFLEEIALIQEVEQENKDTDQKPVYLMTLHGAKGLEFDFVSILGLEDGNFPSQRKTKEEQEEERRLLYVGITRAKEKLLISFAQQRYEYGKLNFFNESKFLKEIPADLKEENKQNLNTIAVKQDLRRWVLDEKKIVQNTYSSFIPKSSPLIDSKKDTAEFLVNTLVQHTTFGIGVVKKVFKEGDNLFLEIFFRDSLKKINSKFVKKI